MDKKTQVVGGLSVAVLGGVVTFGSTPLMTAKFDQSRAAQSFYQQTNLVSDESSSASHVDANLINPWGIAFNPNGFVWVADNETGVSTLYDGLGNPQSLVVTIPTLPGSNESAHATGIVFSGTTDFPVSSGGTSGPSRFIFATQEGTISGWSPAVSATNAIQVVDYSANEAIYMGLAIASDGRGNLLFAADFHNNKVDVFDAMFQPVETQGMFVDPKMPDGFAPFGIHNIGGVLYVTYAKQDEGGEDEDAGYGRGFVDVFAANGFLLRRFASHGHLNAPWGVALAPANFGKFSNHILIGNFGDGRINAFDPITGKFAGMLKDASRMPIEIEGLWGINFGNGLNVQPKNALFFASGPDDEAHGLYGKIEPTPGN